MSTDDFSDLLHTFVARESASTLLAIPGVYALLAEEYNNEILEEWSLNHMWTTAELTALLPSLLALALNSDGEALYSFLHFDEFEDFELIVDWSSWSMVLGVVI